MPLVKITRSRQVTIPKELFEKLDLHQGEYIEITQDGNQLILRPKQIVDREREEAKERFFQTVERIWERNKDLDPEVVEEEAVQALKEVRQHNNPSANANS